ncbi:MAG: DUF120 domain-containing protein [Candidatus Anstonellales archaeon]
MEALIFILSKGGRNGFIQIKNKELAEFLGITPQAVPYVIRKLESEKLITKKDGKIKITEKGVEECMRYYSILKSAFERDRLCIRGKVVSGLGEGKKFLSIKEYRKGISEAIGFIPFEGTLNIVLPDREVWKREVLMRKEPIFVRGFKKGEELYGGVYLYPCRINKRRACIIIPLKSRHPSNVVEIIARENLRKMLRLKNNSEVIVEVEF